MVCWHGMNELYFCQLQGCLGTLCIIYINVYPLTTTPQDVTYSNSSTQTVNLLCKITVVLYVLKIWALKWRGKTEAIFFWVCKGHFSVDAKKKIIDDDDDCTLTGILRPLNNNMNHILIVVLSIHRRRHCINFMLVFTLFAIILLVLLVPYHILDRYPPPALTISPKIETGETWSIFNLLNRN